MILIAGVAIFINHNSFWTDLISNTISYGFTWSFFTFYKDALAFAFGIVILFYIISTQVIFASYNLNVDRGAFCL